MLTRAQRLTSGESFRDAVRRGSRSGGPLLVVHLWVRDTGSERAQAGFVVSKAVGDAVTRNLVKRRLRHLTRGWIASLPDSGVLVVRALPPAAATTYAELGAELDRCLHRVLVTGGRT